MKLLQSPQRLQLWQRMVSSNHLLYQRLQYAAKTNTYGDFGQLGCTLYGWTGDVKWVPFFWKAFTASGWPAIVAADHFIDQNTVREYGTTWVLFYDWLKDVLTPTQKQVLKDVIWNGVQTSLKLPPAVNGGWRFADTDQTMGQYFLCVLAELVIGADDPRFVGLMARYPLIGGLDASATSSLRKTARDAIADYVHAASGSTWPVGSEYNCGDMSILLMGYEMVKNATGQDHFPEVTNWMQSVPAGVIMETCPDFAQIAQWNDDEHATLPEAAVLKQRIVFCALAASVMGNTPEASYLQAYMDTLQRLSLTLDPHGYGQSVLPRYYLFADPYSARVDWKKPLGLHYSADGTGLVRVYSGWGAKDSLAHVQFNPTRGIDHEQITPSTDVRVYRNGEWVFNHPIGYGVFRSPHTNTAGSFEEPGMANRQIVGQSAGDGFGYVWSRTGGVLQNVSYRPPAAWIKELSRACVYLRLPDGSDCILCLDYWDLDWNVVSDMAHKLVNFAQLPTVDKTQILTSGHPATIRFHCPTSPLTSGNGNRLDFSWPTLRSVVTGACFTPAGYTYQDVDESVAFAAIKGNFQAGALHHHLMIAPTLTGAPFYCLSVLVAHDPTVPAPVVTWDAVGMRATVEGMAVQFDTINKKVLQLAAAAP